MNEKKRARLLAARRRRRRRRIIIAAAAGALLVAALLTVLLVNRNKPLPAIPEIQVTFPVEYEAAIRIYADRFGVPASYVAATIMAESGYRAEAVSSANAQGLMQITPETGEWIAMKLRETYTEGCLLDPDTNLRFGCWMLGFLCERYQGDIATCSSAYHQGYHKVDEWLEQPEYSADGKKIDVIPSEATDSYVRKILNYEEFYQTIYG